MNLPNKAEEVKKKIKSTENDIIIVLVILFVGFLSFGLGRLSAFSERKTSVNVESQTSSVVLSEIGSVGLKIEKIFVASKSGTKYHYPWCGGAQRIKEENKIWFSTKEEAEKAGYSPAGNCKGL